METILITGLVGCISFVFGYGMHIQDVKKNLKNCLRPYLDDANGLYWRIDTNAAIIAQAKKDRGEK